MLDDAQETTATIISFRKGTKFSYKIQDNPAKNSLNQPKFCRVINADRTDIENRKQSIYQKVIAI